MSTAIASALAACEVYDSQGNLIRLGELWAKRPALLTWVRHFGCIFCSEQVAQMQRLAAQVRAAGAHCVIIGNGSVEQAAEFEKESAGEIPVYTDPHLHTYRVVGAKRNLLRPQVIAYGLRAYRAGHRQRGVKGSPAQHGAVLLVLPDNTVPWQYISRAAGDHPSDANILGAVAEISM